VPIAVTVLEEETPEEEIPVMEITETAVTPVTMEMPTIMAITVIITVTETVTITVTVTVTETVTVTLTVTAVIKVATSSNLPVLTHGTGVEAEAISATQTRGREASTGIRIIPGKVTRHLQTRI
jgi:carbohydrate-binding DOMON domain-containing protein